MQTCLPRFDMNPVAASSRMFASTKGTPVRPSICNRQQHSACSVVRRVAWYRGTPIVRPPSHSSHTRPPSRMASAKADAQVGTYPRFEEGLVMPPWCVHVMHAATEERPSRISASPPTRMGRVCDGRGQQRTTAAAALDAKEAEEVAPYELENEPVRRLVRDALALVPLDLDVNVPARHNLWPRL